MWIFRKEKPYMDTRVLEGILGKRLISARRQLYKDDFFMENYEQEADGPVELAFSDGGCVHFVIRDSWMSVGAVDGPMPKYGEGYQFSDVSNNAYWNKRVRSVVARVDVFSSKIRSRHFPCESVKITFDNMLHTNIVYNDMENNQTDAMIIADYEHESMYRIIWSTGVG